MINKLQEIYNQNKPYFKDAFDFVSMEKEAEIKKVLDNIRDLEFDIFDLRQKSSGNELFLTIMHLMQSEGFITEFNISQKKLRNFAYCIQSSYNDVKYHNKTHASDVWQTWYYFMFTWDFNTTANWDRLEQAWMLLAGVVHDVDHPGFNNLYMINTKNELAITYNDWAVLENYHVATAFRVLLAHSGWDIFENFKAQDFTKARKLIIDFVLSTDMARHFGDMNKFKSRVESYTFDAKGEDRKLSSEFLFHMADISNPTKPWEICK